MQLILDYDDYIDLLKQTGIEDFINTLIKKNMESRFRSLVEDIAPAEKIVTEENVLDLFPVESCVRQSKYAHVVTSGFSSWINAYSALKKPEEFARIINLINKELNRVDGLEYEIGDPEFKMLGLANRYAENAAQCKLLYQWDRYNFYMNMLVYFLPFLVMQAGLKEEDVKRVLSGYEIVEIPEQDIDELLDAIDEFEATEVFDPSINDAEVVLESLSNMQKAIAKLQSAVSKPSLKTIIGAFDPASLDEKIRVAEEQGNEVLKNRLLKLKQHFDRKKEND